MNKTTRKAFSASNGFTLAEILVVGAIVAILAAVSIPMYAGYVKNERLAAAKNLAETAAVAANNLWRETGANPNSAALRLKVFLPRPDLYQITVVGNSVVVTEGVGDDAVQGTAPFRP